ncbi:MAG: polysaccharide biosynthesis protein [Oceanospirillaceae bacterium]|nr:polysaccharide biosynthesis protein [Oceanospirillaceae bacterium]MCP5335206.1 polysaccharide biosynthesis protein [Oceanospirillaceae bacterium]
MNKLEKAISLSMSEDNHLRNFYRATSEQEYIDQVAGMQEEFLLTPEQLTDKKIVFPSSAQKAVVHKFRDIRTALKDNKTKNITLVTSVDVDAGTSYFAANLAAVTAFDPARSALLIDCNLDRPSVGDKFAINGPGILEYIYDESLTVEDIIHAVGIERYRCIPAGKAKGSIKEYFTNPRFKALLSEIKLRYPNRNIFIDAPSILTSADTRILFDVCDQVVVVVPYGVVGERTITDACRVIPKEKFAGVVLNDYVG